MEKGCLGWGGLFLFDVSPLPIGESSISPSKAQRNLNKSLNISINSLPLQFGIPSCKCDMTNNFLIFKSRYNLPFRYFELRKQILLKKSIVKGQGKIGILSLKTYLLANNCLKKHRHTRVCRCFCSLFFTQNLLF